MKLISAIVCTTAAMGTSLLLPTVASATDVHCTSERGSDITVIDGRTGCRAASDTHGRASSAGYDGIGYANATAGADAYGIGAAGGIGASEGMGGIPIAIGIGADALALTSIADTRQGDNGSRLVAVSIAFDGSRAGVETTNSAVVCLGTAAFAWNSATGATCLATPFGRWQTPTSD
ncbi:DUF6764 family protein [Nocardia australiensis]|uniref:DUF6764 family protein n=1 Tax=Nocardia australiensis TaxID=2887191 RepID=UPI001D13D3AA|nr:DUF6764 family protein [Nocardia australiensis]